MDSIGRMLRCERERQKRSLSEIATQTCIGSMYLDAIERDDISILPGYFFYKSFVKQYASALGVEDGDLEAALTRAEPKTEPDPLPALSVNYQPLTQWTVRGSRLAEHAALVSAATMLLIMVTAAGSYSWWHRAHVKADPVAPVLHASTVEPDKPPVEDSKANPPAADPSALAPEMPPRHSVNLLAREKTWISLKSAGKTIFRGTLAARESKEIEIVENAKLTTGNAAALDVTLNGRPLGPLGARGQVRTILFAQGGAQILGGRL